MIEIEVRAAPETVTPVDELQVPYVAWIEAVPSADPVATPALVIGATIVADEVHVLLAVRSCVLPSV